MTYYFLFFLIMPRFYIACPINIDDTIQLSENVTHHLRVRRMPTNSNITLFNGDGKNYHALINIESKNKVLATILSAQENHNESALDITLIQSLSTGDRMDYTLQKSVELGLNTIQPVISARCTLRLKGERAEKKVKRWQEIVIAACEQSGRSKIPKVLPIINYEQAFNNKADINFILSIGSTHQLRDYQQSVHKINLIAGPEGGFTAEEEKLAFAQGFLPLTLGPRVLRTETAAVAAVAALQTLWGDF